MAILVGHLFLRATWPSRGGHKEDSFGALLEAILCIIVASLLGVLVSSHSSNYLKEIYLGSMVKSFYKF
jgi:hypothetical protein